MNTWCLQIDFFRTQTSMFEIYLIAVNTQFAPFTVRWLKTFSNVLKQLPLSFFLILSSILFYLRHSSLQCFSQFCQKCRPNVNLRCNYQRFRCSFRTISVLLKLFFTPSVWISFIYILCVLSAILLGVWYSWFLSRYDVIIKLVT